MSEEYIKLVAKVQHFYERLVSKNESLIDSAISDLNSDKKAVCEKSKALNEVLYEYEKAFESFLYKSNSENR